MKNLKKRNQQYNKIITSEGINYQISEGNEINEAKSLSALSNENRLKILKHLAKGDSYYTQIERELGLKGCHFKFHLEKLINENFVTHKEQEKCYSITLKD